MLTQEISATANTEAESFPDDLASLMGSFEGMSDQELEARISKENPTMGSGANPVVC
jgi:hypothetical protein